jgi:hypothetical protein
MQFLQRRLQKTSWAGRDRFARIWVEEADQKEWHIILPRYPPKTAQIRNRNKIMVSVLRIADLQFSEICLIVHVPTKNHRAESEPLFRNAQEFLLGDQLAAQYAIGVDTGKLDFGVIFEEFWQRIESYLGVFFVRHLGGSLAGKLEMVAWICLGKGARRIWRFAVGIVTIVEGSDLKFEIQLQYLEINLLKMFIVSSDTFQGKWDH